MTLKSNTLKTGLAMFAMFFGAGNVAYPLSVGHLAQDAHFWGILGLLVTAVGVPFLGLISVVLFGGDYESFFGRLGKWPGFILTVLILALIGPFGHSSNHHFIFCDNQDVLPYLVTSSF